MMQMKRTRYYSLRLLVAAVDLAMPAAVLLPSLLLLPLSLAPTHTAQTISGFLAEPIAVCWATKTGEQGRAQPLQTQLPMSKVQLALHHFE